MHDRGNQPLQMGHTRCVRNTLGRRWGNDVGRNKIFYSGRNDNHHREGVALLLGKRAQRAYKEHRAVNSRIISVTMQGRHKNVKIIQTYAPDGSHEEEDVEEFYDNLEEEMRRTKAGDITIVIGDFNSKIGNDNIDYEDVMGKFGLGDRNERGERMLEFCQRNQLSITNTYYYHRVQHRHTWTHPDGRHKNCIDYILIDKRWKTSVRGTKVMRGADFNTSHELLLSNIQLKFKTTNEIKHMTTMYNLEKLRSEDIKSELKIRIGGRFEPLLETEEDVDNLWRKGRDIIREEAETILGRKRKIRQQWITDEILDLCTEKREAKKARNTNPSQESINRHRQKCNQVKQKCREAKRQWIANQCKNCEDSFRRGQSRELYRTVRTITKEWKNNTTTIKNDNGEKISDKEEVSKIWRNHFQRVLKGDTNGVNHEEYPELRRTTQETQNAPNILKTDIERAIKTLAKEKSPGIDGIPVELLLAGEGAIVNWLHKLYQSILNGEEMPEDWREAVIIPIYKKGDVTKCENYRPISLLPHAYKILSKIIQDRIQRREEEILKEEQAGFRKGRGTTDHIFTFSQRVEKMWEKNKDIHCVFIDFKQAFDSVWRYGMIEVMNFLGFEENLKRTIKKLYENTTAKIRKDSIISENFETTGGVIQGRPLSPHLFNIYLEWIMGMALADQEGGITVNGTKITNLRYADDIVLLAESKEELQNMTTKIEEQCIRYKMKINSLKTKSMKIGRQNEVLNIQTSEGQVEEFKYLGVTFTSQGETTKAIQERITLGQRAFGRLKRVWNDRLISQELKIRLLKA